MGIKIKLGWIFFILLIAMSLLIGCEKKSTVSSSNNSPKTAQTSKTLQPPESISKPQEAIGKESKPVSENEELLKQIKVESEIQDLINGKQKVVVFVTNNSQMLFDGSVLVDLYDVSDKGSGGDTIFVEKLVPGGKTWAIIWGKPGAKKAKYNISGNFSKFEAPKSTLEYEVANTKPGLNYQTFFVVVPKIEEKGLVDIVKEFRNKYTKQSVLGFQIFFFTKDNLTEAKNGKLGSEKANYSVNYNNGHSDLFISESGKSIKIE